MDGYQTAIEDHLLEKLALTPSDGNFLNMLGSRFCLDGKIGYGQTLMKRSIICDAERADYHYNFAISWQLSGKEESAISAFHRVIVIEPDHADSYDQIASFARRQGNKTHAITLWHHAICCKHDQPDLLVRMANALKTQGNLGRSSLLFRQTIIIHPQNSTAYNNLGVIILDKKEPQSAIWHWKRAIFLNNEFAEACSNLGNALMESKASREAGKEQDEAIFFLHKAITIDPQNWGVYNNIGFLLQSDRELHWAISLNSEFAEAHANLGNEFLKNKQFHEAKTCFLKAISLTPDFAEAHLAFAFYLLATGKFDAGWKKYEWRWQTPSMLPILRNYPMPIWQGTPGNGRRLLIYGEQGHGDILQFCRYVPLAAAIGWKVILEIPYSLKRLLQSLEGVEQLITMGDKTEQFDEQCPMLSLPMIFKTNLHNIPTSPSYLNADKKAAAIWQERLYREYGNAPRIGLVWAGNPKSRRSIAVEILAPLLKRKDIVFFSLQKSGPPPPPELGMVDVMPEMSDFADTAALIVNLNLVISIDTAMVHLSAALGKPVWLIDRFSPCWRWLDNRNDSPWYPTLRIFRQKKHGDWEEVMGEVLANLGREIPPTDQSTEHTRLASHLHSQGDMKKAAMLLHMAIIIDPQNATAYNNLGAILKNSDKKESEKPIWLWNRSVRLDSQFVEAYASLGCALIEERHYERNEESQREVTFFLYRTIILNPQDATAYSNLGVVLYGDDQKELNTAIRCWNISSRLDDKLPETYANLGNALLRNRDFEETKICCRKGIVLNPDYADAHVVLSFALLATEDFVTGWRHYEWRWKLASMAASVRNLPFPRWQGEEGNGKKLLIYGEQGHGDTLQFCRYIPLVAARGWRIILEVQPFLTELMESLEGVEQIIPMRAKTGQIDMQCPMLSLPMIFGTNLHNIPTSNAYLHADIEKTATWRERLSEEYGNTPRIGLVWAGDPRSSSLARTSIDNRRSIAPEKLAPLFQRKDIIFFSLQKTGQPPPQNFDLIDVMAEISDFSDMAALVVNLDLVISVDTAMIHLAAALGKPAWMIDRFDSCWRWLINRNDSPWYPTLRIFRQTKPGDWSDVIEKIAFSLDDLFQAERKPPLPPFSKWGKEMEAVQLDPTNAAKQSSLGNIMELSGFPEEALYHYLLAIILQCDSLTASVNAGILMQKQGKREAALSLCRHAITINNHSTDAHYNLGYVLYDQGKPKEAMECWREALKLDPELVDAHNSMGAAAQAAEKWDESIISLSKAIILQPDFVYGYNNLAGTLQHKESFLQAIGSIYRATLLNPDFADAWYGLGQSHYNIGNFAAAESAFRQSIQISERIRLNDLSLANYHCSLSFALLAQGKFIEGWQEYEWRWQSSAMINAWRDFGVPQWNGETGNGRTILIHAEQGYGDDLQFSRYLPLIAARGWKIILEANAPIVSLIGNMGGIEQTVPFGKPLPPFDAHCPMMSLPLVFRTQIDNIPADIPYLQANQTNCDIWRNRLLKEHGKAVRIGLVWAGNPRPHMPECNANDRKRSIPPELLLPLLQIPGLKFFNLQKSDLPPPVNMHLIDYMNEIHDFSDAACLVTNIDLIITVDTAMVHLAGALGKPVWMMDRYDSCWRWMRGHDSPWYPDLRIFRQTKPGDWSDVIDEIMACLGELFSAETRSPLHPFFKGGENAEVGSPPSEKSGGREFSAQHEIVVSPESANGYYDLGNAQMLQGNLKNGTKLWEKSIRIAPDHIQARTNLANSLSEQDESEAAYRLVLAIKPDHIPAQTNLCILMQQQNRPSEIKIAAMRSVLLDPANAAKQSNLGNVLESSGFLEKAVYHYLRAIILQCDLFIASVNCGILMQKHGKNETALSLSRHAVTIDKSSTDAHYNLGYVLYEQGNPKEAMSCWREALKLDPELVEAHNSMGAAAQAGEQFDESILSFRKTIVLQPDFIYGYNNLSNALRGKELFHQAIGFIHRAALLAPDFADAWYGLGQLHYILGNLIKAEAAFRQAAKISGKDNASLPNYHCSLSFSLLAQGKFAEGWQEYEWRWQTDQLRPAIRHFNQPQWNGEDGNGKKMLVYGEQGLGDVIHFCRYVPLLSQKGWRVLMEVRRPLLHLMNSLDGTEHIFAVRDDRPDFDSHCPIMSLPLFFGTDLTNIPSFPIYLRPDKQKRLSWSKKLVTRHGVIQKHFRVGLAWVGAIIDRKRSIPTELLAPLLDNPSVIFFNLQKEHADIPPHLPIVNYMDEIDDFSDSAGFIANLDLIISIDTAVAHLAGAMGKNIWLMARHDACWRWLRDREDSPWYPSMRIFRQDSPGDWLGMIKQVREALDEFIYQKDGIYRS